MTIFDAIRYQISCPVHNSELGRLPDDVFDEYLNLFKSTPDLQKGSREEHDVIYELLLRR